jgi:hypothetical protein
VIDKQSDSTPLLTVSDSLPLIEFVSGIVAVARLNATSKDAVKPIARVVSNVGGTLLGSVATGADAGGLYGGYGYGYRQDSSANGSSPTDGSSTKPEAPTAWASVDPAAGQTARNPSARGQILVTPATPAKLRR